MSSKKHIWLVDLVNCILCLSLQIAIGQAIIPLYRSICFFYIAFFLSLPWQKNNLILQLLLGFFVGLTIDAFYDSVGIHTFAAVLLMYCRSFLLHILPPSAVNGYKYPIRPSLINMGFKKFSLYVLLLICMYHITVFCLDTRNFVSFFTALPQLSISIFLNYLFICLFQIISVALANTSIH